MPAHIILTCKTIPVLGVISLLTFYCYNNPFCYLSDQIRLPDVELS